MIHREHTFRVSPEISSDCKLCVSRLRRLAVVTFYVLPITVAAQSVSCKGPSDLEQTVASNPSAAAFNALGTYFAGLRQYPCAISAFESAIRLAPNAWEGPYNLGLACSAAATPVAQPRNWRLLPGSSHLTQESCFRWACR
jgi:tetratricopeptide (TPR) repeat protein